MPTPVRAVAYYRMSTGKQEASIPEQRAWARSACKRHGVEVVREFEDPGVPGSEIEHRPGLMDMLAFCEARAADRPVEAVVAWDADRLSRANSIRTAAFLDRLMTAGVSRMLTQEGWLDFESDIDRVMFHIRQDTGREAFSRSLSKNVARSAVKRAREGRWVCGRPPYGYAVGPDGRLAPSGDHAETVRWIFRQFADSADSLGDLARRLRERGAPPPPARRRRDGGALGGAWTRYGVRNVLANRAYLGELVWNARRRGKYSRVSGGEVSPVRGRARGVQANDPADRIVIPDAHPALTDRETFDACARKLAATRWKRTTPAAGGGEWVLTGFLYCGDCGGRMMGHTDRVKRGRHTYVYRQYVCHTNVRMGPGTCRRNAATQETVLREVAALIRSSFTEPARLAELRAEVEELVRKQAESDGADRARIAERLRSLDRLIDQGTERILLVPKDMIDQATGKVREWQAEREQLARELARMEAAAESGERFTARVGEALGQLKHLEETITEAPPDRVRDVLAGLVRKITLNFEQGKELANGRRRHRLTSLEVELQPEAAGLLQSPSYLCGTSSNPGNRSATIPPRRP